MADSLVTVAQFHVSGDAAVAKHAMDNAGIESEVEDVRLEVHNVDAFRAYHVLDTDCETLPVVDEPYEAAKTPPSASPAAHPPSSAPSAASPSPAWPRSPSASA